MKQVDELAQLKQQARAEARENALLSNQAFLKRFEAHTERGTALSAVAYLDVKVKRFVKNMWIDNKAEVENFLRAEGGPLSSLGSLIGLCYLSGFLAQRTFKDLCFIRDIRNVFAHTLEADNFSFPRIDNLCKKLQIFENPIEFFGKGDEDYAKYQIEFYTSMGHDLKDHKWGFVAAVGFLANQFQRNQHHPRNIRDNCVKIIF